MATTFRTPPPTHSSPAHVTRKPGRHRAAILACAFLSLALGEAAKAAPGDLDPSFDADGLVLTHFGRIDDDSPGGRNDFGNAVAVAPDGKLVVVGSSQASGDLNFNDFALARYNPDGTPGTSFGSGGRVLTDFPSEFGPSFDDALAVVVQPDGKLVVAGTSDFKPVLARYHMDGSLDTSFDNDGFVLIDFRPDVDSFGILESSIASALVLQPDGKLVVAGSSRTLNVDTFEVAVDFALARFNPDGSLDTGFGSGGLVLTDFEDPPFGPEFEAASALVLQFDGKLVAAGQGACGLALARYSPDGSLDGTFGFGGTR